MIHVDIYTETLSRDGQAHELLAAALTVDGHDLIFNGGDAQHVNLGLPVYSDKRERLITFEDDPEEWARLLPTAYRNGAVRAEAKEIIVAPGTEASEDLVPELALHLAF